MATINYLTTIEFDRGAIATLPAQLSALGITRPLIVSDPGLVAAGLVDRIRNLCPPGAELFLDVPSNPTEAATKSALQVFRTGNSDGLVAVGGGSPIDLA